MDKIKENLKDMIYFPDEHTRKAYFADLEKAVADAGIAHDDADGLTKIANKLADDKGLTHEPKAAD